MIHQVETAQMKNKARDICMGLSFWRRHKLNYNSQVTINREMCTMKTSQTSPTQRTLWLFLLWKRHIYFLRPWTYCYVPAAILYLKKKTNLAHCNYEFFIIFRIKGNAIHFNSIHDCFFCAETEQHCYLMFWQTALFKQINSNTAKNNVPYLYHCYNLHLHYHNWT
jgi:hypothetical protein